MSKQRITLKELKEELEKIKSKQSKQKKSTVSGPVLNTSKIRTLFMQSSMFWMFLITGILGYLSKLPFFGKLVGILSLWYGRTTWWLFLIKIRKIFILINAFIGLMMVMKTSGMADNNMLAAIYAMTGTYLDIIGSVFKRLFNSIFDLFGYSIEPTLPKSGGGSKGNGGIINKILPDSSNLKKVIVEHKMDESFRSKYAPKIGGWFDLPWSKNNTPIPSSSWIDSSTIYWLLGITCAVGISYLSYKLIQDPSIIYNYFHAINPDNTTPTQGTGPNLPPAPPLGGVEGGVEIPEITLGSQILDGFQDVTNSIRDNAWRLNPLNWYPSAAEHQRAHEMFLQQQRGINYSNRYYPYTPIDPFASWYSKMKLHFYGESTVDLVERLRIRELWNSMAVPELQHLGRVNNVVTNVGIGTQIPSPFLQAVQLSQDAFAVAEKIAGIPSTPTYTPHLSPLQSFATNLDLPDFVQGSSKDIPTNLSKIDISINKINQLPEIFEGSSKDWSKTPQIKVETLD